jgi:hypothetical protein
MSNNATFHLRVDVSMEVFTAKCFPIIQILYFERILFGTGISVLCIFLEMVQIKLNRLY